MIFLQNKDKNHKILNLSSVSLQKDIQHEKYI
jgi:hypothetical protein